MPGPWYASTRHFQSRHTLVGSKITHLLCVPPPFEKSLVSARDEIRESLLCSDMAPTQHH